MSKQRGKNLAVDRGPLAAGAPSHGTTGTMVNPALHVCNALFCSSYFLVLFGMFLSLLQ